MGKREQSRNGPGRGDREAGRRGIEIVKQTESGGGGGRDSVMRG